MRQNLLRLAAVVVAFAGTAASVEAQPVAPSFTYQGELRDGASPMEGATDLLFTLWTASVGGAPVGSAQEVLGAAVTAGRFSAVLNAGGEFGPSPFGAGQRRWLEIGVRPAGSGGAYQTLTPRQELTAAPFAAYALAAGSAVDAATLGGQGSAFYLNAGNLTGTVADARLSTNVPRLNGTNVFSGATTLSNAGNAFTGSGAGLTGLNAANLASGTLADGRLSANVPLKNGANAFTAVNSFTNAGNAFTGSFAGVGSGLTGLNASSVTLGLLPEAVLPGSVARTNTANTFAGASTFSATSTFNGAALFNGLFGVGTNLPNAAFRAQFVGGSGVWKGGVAAGGATAAVVMGEIGSVATLGGHNGALNAWGPLAINPTGASVGVGTSAPQTMLHVLSPSHLAGEYESASPAGTWLQVGNTTAGGQFWKFISTGTGNGEGAGKMMIGWGAFGALGGSALTLTPTGNVGVGTTAPAVAMHVALGSDASLAGGGYLVTGATNGLNIVMDNNEILARNNGAATPLYLNQGGGNVVVPVLQITGGSDVAEPYDVAAAAGTAPEAGMVVTIDPEHVGKMKLASGAYDRTVAGIISGANGVKPGLTLTQSGTIADGAMPVASVGRVWCWCDADAAGAISAGDMLTTSDTPGHAMRAADRERSQGAVLGKAMSSLKSGKGMVLVLVTLQ